MKLRILRKYTKHTLYRKLFIKNVRKKTLFLSLFSPTSSLTKLSYMPHPGPPTRTGYIFCLGQPAGGAHFKEESLALKENTLWKPTGCCSIRSVAFICQNWSSTCTHKSGLKYQNVLAPVDPRNFTCTDGCRIAGPLTTSYNRGSEQAMNIYHHISAEPNGGLMC